MRDPRAVSIADPDALYEMRFVTLGMDSLSRVPVKLDWFCLDWPKVVQKLVRSQKVIETTLVPSFTASLYRGEIPPYWSVIHPTGFDAVHWTFFEMAPPFSCNGIQIRDPQGIRVIDDETGTGWREPGTEALDVYSDWKTVYVTHDPSAA